MRVLVRAGLVGVLVAVMAAPALAGPPPTVMTIAETTSPRSESGSGCGPFVDGAVTFARSSTDGASTVVVAVAEVSGDAVLPATEHEVVFADEETTASMALVPSQRTTAIEVTIQESDTYTVGEPGRVVVPVDDSSTFCMSGGTPPAATVEPSSGPAGTDVVVRGAGCPQPSWNPSFTWTVHVQTGRGGSAPSAGQITGPDGGPPSSPFSWVLVGYTGVADAYTTPAPDGTWSVALRIPGPGDNFPATPGVYPISAACYPTEGSNLGHVGYAEPVFEVVGPVVRPPEVVLARTGTPHLFGAVVLAIALIAMGTALRVRAGASGARVACGGAPRPSSS